MDYLIYRLLCAVAATAIGARKGEAWGALFAGVLLGPWGILVALASSGYRKWCPACGQRVHKRATMCPECCQALVAPIP